MADFRSALFKIRIKADSILNKTAGFIQQQAREVVLDNRSSGRASTSPLADSIHVEREAVGQFRVGVSSPYAPFVEFGTSTQSAEPFLQPVIERVLADRQQI